MGTSHLTSPSRWVLFLFVSFLLVIALLGIYGRSFWFPVYIKMVGKRTTQEVYEQYSARIEPKLNSLFAQANLAYPPQKIAFYAIKQEKILELWAKNDGPWTRIKNYPILKMSGKLGPKLREGDKQVPEGIYKIIGLNPNSAYHLSMKLNYPNAFDLKYANQDGRENPGSNIFIHGKAISVGCLAMGDKAIEELFLLSHKMGGKDIEVVISPIDFRHNRPIIPEGTPVWTMELYQLLIQAGKKYN